MLMHDASCDSVFLSHQADATHERVVKREDGERLAKVNYSESFDVIFQLHLNG